MRCLCLSAVLFLAACGPATLPAPTPTATERPTLTAAPTATPTEAPPSPTVAPTVALTVRPTPIPFDESGSKQLTEAVLNAVALPKPFPYRVQFYDAPGSYHASFGGFDKGTAVLLIGKTAVQPNVVVHEYGHAWHEWFMAYDTARWKEYGAIRGYTDAVQLFQGTLYLDDWRERFANDFQWAYNPDWGGRYAPGIGYWSEKQYADFKAFVRALADRPRPTT